MANLNTKKIAPVNKTVNMAGGTGYALDAKNELVGILLTSLAEDTYYETADARNTRIGQVMAKVDPLFAAKAAVYARDTFGMRSITHIAAVMLAGAQFPEKRAFYRNIVVRPDDALSILAGYGVENPIPNAMKRGLADALAKFKPETLAKYKGTDREVNMYDAINLVHPNSAGVNAFMKGEVVSGDTWEVALSQGGDKYQTWRGLVLTHKLGIMALLRNLRNIVEYCGNDAEVMDAVAAQLTDREAVLRSRLFPYRFLAAYQVFMAPEFSYRALEVQAPQKILTAINRAAEISLINVPELPGSSALLMDVSASMTAAMSKNSKMRMIDAGAMLAAMLFKKNPDSELVKYGTNAKKVQYNADMPLLEIAKSFAMNDGLGHGTSIPAGFQALTGRHNRVIVVSDMMTWAPSNDYYYGYSVGDGQEAWKMYNKRVGANSFGYEIDLAGHGTTALNNRSDREFFLPTITDKVFTVMGALETGGAGLVETIDKVVL